MPDDTLTNILAELFKLNATMTGIADRPPMIVNQHGHVIVEPRPRVVVLGREARGFERPAPPAERHRYPIEAMVRVYRAGAWGNAGIHTITDEELATLSPDAIQAWSLARRLARILTDSSPEGT